MRNDVTYVGNSIVPTRIIVGGNVGRQRSGNTSSIPNIILVLLMTLRH